MRTRAALLFGGVAVVLPFFAPAPTLAQSAATAAPESETSVGEVVVTALKRRDTVQKVAASITAVSGDTLARNGVQDTRDLSKVIPNLSWGEHFGTTEVFIRGIGTSVDSGITEPTVAMYVDGIYLPRTDMATLRAVDLDRVEVLRGPQGTLYGRNATGGAINFISLEPSHTFEAGITASGGSRSAYGVNGYISGPIAPNLYARLSGGYDFQDGYVTVLNTGQKLNGVNDTFARFALKYDPTSNVSAEMSIRYDRDIAPNAYQEYLAPTSALPSAYYTDAPNKILADYPFSEKNQTWIAAATINWAISDSLKIRSLTGYIDHISSDGVDDDNSLLPIEYSADFVRPSRSISEEVDLVGDTSRVKWILGAFYFHENAAADLPVSLPGTGTIHLGEKSDVNNAAIFGDLTYSITDRLRLNLGLRYNYETNTYQEYWSFAPIAGPESATYHTTTNDALPKVALQYDLTSDMHAYAQWSVGVKTGGVNFPNGSGTLLPLYQPERLNAYEVGLKSQFFDHLFTANLAAFYYDYKNLQVSVDVPPVGTQINPAKARDYGVEGDFRWNVSRAFTISVSPTLLDAQFLNFTSLDSVTGNLITLNHKTLPYAPHFTLNTSAQYRIDLGGDLLSSLTLDGSLLYSSTVVLLYFNDSPEDRQTPYTVGNLSATLADRSDKTHLTVFVDNVGNTLYKQRVGNFGLGYMGNYGPPRTVGVRLSRKF
jgi:iron complex outermembrane receptor protein